MAQTRGVGSRPFTGTSRTVKATVMGGTVEVVLPACTNQSFRCFHVPGSLALDTLHRGHGEGCHSNVHAACMYSVDFPVACMRPYSGLFFCFCSDATRAV